MTGNRTTASVRQLGFSLAYLNLLSVVFLLVRIVLTSNITYWFLAWNLFLAWVPLAAILMLKERLQKEAWLSSLSVGLTAVWLFFLPNSFYVMTDVIHLQSRGDISIMFDAVMIMSFALNGLILGYMSLGIMHRLLMARMRTARAHQVIALVLLLSSFAIYLGRYLRWNSWDVLVSPTGLLFDVSERFINPIVHIQTYAMTLVFFAFLSVLYIFTFRLVDYLKNTKQK